MGSVFRINLIQNVRQGGEGYEGGDPKVIRESSVDHLARALEP